MLSYLFDFLFVLIAVAAAYWISRQGLVHGAGWFVALLLASLLSITTFEPVARWIDWRFLTATDYLLAMHLYFIICMGFFVAALVILLGCIHAMLPDPPQMSPRVESIGSWVCGAFGGYLLAAFLLAAVQTFPAPREYWGAFRPEAHRRPGPIMAWAPDYQFLALAEFTCEHSFALAGGKWLLDRPVVSADLKGGRWSTFPIRYAKWRELHH